MGKGADAGNEPPAKYGEITVGIHSRLEAVPVNETEKSN